jgi:DeoR/GlpR family transcriptional regulator of sugar metabolism
MGPDQRQRAILEQLLDRGTATIGDLAALCDVSEMTIYRDVDQLERQGVVRKFRGGITAQPSGVFESSAAYRLRHMVAEKEAIARRARELVEPGMSVILDDATTTLALARLLGDVAPLTVATNYLEALRVLSSCRDLSLIALGGNYDHTHDSFTGTTCVDAIDALTVDITFVSVSAISGGYTHHQEQHIVAVKRAMLRSARQRILLADHSKLSRDALHRLAPLSEFDLVIIDSGASPESLRELDEQGVPYRLAAGLLPVRPAVGLSRQSAVLGQVSAGENRAAARPSSRSPPECARDRQAAATFPPGQAGGVRRPARRARATARCARYGPARRAPSLTRSATTPRSWPRSSPSGTCPPRPTATRTPPP